MKTKELDLETGIKKIISVLESVDERPVLASFYGQPNRGNSRVIDTLIDYFTAKGREVGRGTGAPIKSCFDRIALPKNDIVLFHCAWLRTIDPKLTSTSEDPNYLAQTILNRELNLNVCVYNPRFYQRPDRKLYDLVICNPGSVRKWKQN